MWKKNLILIFLIGILHQSESTESTVCVLFEKIFPQKSGDIAANKTVIETNCTLNNFDSLDANILKKDVENIDNVTEVHFSSSSNIPVLDNVLFETFKNLKWADMNNIGVKEIEPKAFRNASTLKVMNLEGNEIEELKANAFLGANLLRVLYLGYNKIHKIDRLAFNELHQLIYLGLQSNKISQIEKGTFECLTSTQEINLNHNFITSIDHALFAQTKVLKTLRLDGNNISTLSYADIRYFNSLTTFSLKDNEMYDDVYSGNLTIPETSLRFPKMLFESENFDNESVSNPHSKSKNITRAGFKSNSTNKLAQPKTYAITLLGLIVLKLMLAV